MNRILTALALLFLVVGLTFGYLLVVDGRGTGESRESGRGEARKDGVAPNGLRGADAGALPLPGERGGLRDPDSRVGLAGESKRFGNGAANWLNGSIRLPGDAPRDETLRVLVLSKRLTPAEIHGRGGLSSKLGAGGEPSPEELLAVVETTADGSFRAPVPSDARKVWLALDGRYLYLRQLAEIELPAATAHLSPEVGSWIHGTVALPSELDANSVLSDCSASLKPKSHGGSSQSEKGDWLFARGVQVRKQSGSWTFEHRAVPAGGPFVANVHCDTLIDFSQDGIEPRAGEELVIDVRLSAGASLAGRVLDPAGEPVPRARVRLVERLLFGAPANTISESKSSGDGGFLLEGIPPGKALLVAEKEGYLPSAPSSVQIDEVEQLVGYTLELLPGDALRGIARYATGEPASGARVRVAFDPAAMVGMGAIESLRGGSGSTQADEDGKFIVQGLGAGPFEVTTTTNATEGEYEGLWFGRLAGLEPQAEDVELILHPTRGLRGRVVDLDGAALTVFSLSMELADRDNPLASLQESTWGLAGLDDPESGEREAILALDRRSLDVQDENGAFTIRDLHAGAWRLTVSADGFATPEPSRLDLPEAAGSIHIVTLAPEARVSGRVLTRDGVPVAHASVTLQVGRSQTLAKLTGSLELPETVSDEEGNYTLGGLRAGTVGLIADHTDYAAGMPATLEIEAGQILEGIHLTLRAGGTLSGVVHGKDGEPALGLRVIIQNQANFATETTHTGEGGTFRVEHLGPGTYRVTAMLSKDGWGAGVQNASDTAGVFENLRFTLAKVEDGEETTIRLGAPPSDPVLVYGKVTRAGEPIPQALVTFTHEKGQGFESMKFTQTGADGTYETELPAPGRHLISVQIIGSGRMEQQRIEYNREIPDHEEVQLDFELPGARISGRIEDAEGRTLAGARVSLGIEGGIATGTMLGGHYSEVTTNALGYYSFDYLRAGFYSVAAGGSPFGGALGTHVGSGRAIQDRIRVTENEHRSGIDFRLRKAGNIKGTIRDLSGSPVGGASVFVRDERGRLLERFSLTSTGPDGVYEYSGLAPGSYRVTARAEGATSSPRDWVRVREAATATADLSVDAGTVLEIQLIDAAGKELDATLSVTDEEGNEMTGMLAYSELIERATHGFRSDVQRVGPLPGGKYTLRADTKDGRSAEKTVTVRGKPERRIELRIK